MKVINIHLLSVVRLEQQGTELVLTRQAYQETLYDAETDDLTGLLNRKVLLWEAEKVLSSARETGCAIWMIDLDRIKDVNDEYGHSMGDQVLTTVAHKLISLFPADALVARYGGDEFCVFFPQISLEGLYHILQQALTGFSFTCEKSSNVVQIAASLEAAYVPPERTITCQKLFEQADEALSTSKNNERHLYSLKEL